MDRLLNSETTQIVITLLLAVLGGAARILSQKDKNGVNAANVLSGCLVACFTGLLAHFAAGYFNLTENIAYIISGICGWLGPQVIDVFANLVLQKAGINLQLNAEDRLTPKDPGAKLVDDEALYHLTVTKPAVDKSLINERAIAVSPALPEERHFEEPAGASVLEESAAYAPVPEGAPADQTGLTEDTRGPSDPPAEPIGLTEPLEEPFGLINPIEEPTETAAPTVESDDKLYIKINKPRKSKKAVLSESIDNTEPATLNMTEGGGESIIVDPAVKRTRKPRSRKLPESVNVGDGEL